MDGPSTLHAFAERASRNRLWARTLVDEADMLPGLVAQEPELAVVAAQADATPSLDAALLDAHRQVSGESSSPSSSLTGSQTGVVDPGLVERLKSRLSAVRTRLGQWRAAADLVRERLAFIERMREISKLPATDPGPGRNDDWSLARNIVFDEEDWMAA